MIFFLLLFLGSLTGPARANPDSKLEYRVLEISGRVLALKPWDYIWNPVSTQDTLPYDSLVQVTEGGKLTLEILQEAKPRDKRLVVLIKNTGVLRLDEQTIREVKKKRYYFHDDPFKGQVNFLELAMKEMPTQIKDAWKQVAAVFAPKKRIYNPKFLEYKEFIKKQNLLTLEKKQPIKIITPYAYANYHLDYFPFYLRVMWTDNVPASNRNYVVFFWKMGQPRPEKFFVSSKKMAFLPVYRPNRYFIQVETMNGRYSSKLLQVSLNRGGANAEGIFDVYLEQPPVGAQFFLGQRQRLVKVFFRWQAYLSVFDGFQLVVERLKPQKFYTYKLPQSQSYTEVAFPQGSYRWYVNVIYKNTVVARSTKRPLEVQASTTTLSKQIRQIIGQRQSGTYYFPQ